LKDAKQPIIYDDKYSDDDDQMTPRSEVKVEEFKGNSKNKV
jgi:hypothetical protein